MELCQTSAFKTILYTGDGQKVAQDLPVDHVESWQIFGSFALGSELLDCYVTLRPRLSLLFPVDMTTDCY